MKIGYLGPEGTFTEQAAMQCVGKRQHECLVPIDSIDALVLALQKEKIDAAVAPIDNSLRGEYRETVDGIEKYKFQIATTLILNIHLAIGIHPKSKKETITEIWSKDSALEQCSQYLNKNFQHALRKEVPSTAYAMKTIMKKNMNNVAAIGSEEGMNRYGLVVIDKQIENASSKPATTQRTTGVLSRIVLAIAL